MLGSLRLMVSVLGLRRMCGATMVMEYPVTRTSHCSSAGVFSHLGLRKARSSDPVITGLGRPAGIADAFETAHRVVLDGPVRHRACDWVDRSASLGEAPAHDGR